LIDQPLPINTLVTATKISALPCDYQLFSFYFATRVRYLSPDIHLTNWLISLPEISLRPIYVSADLYPNNQPSTYKSAGGFYLNNQS
jgi:hypothetical protein